MEISQYTSAFAEKANITKAKLKTTLKALYMLRFMVIKMSG